MSNCDWEEDAARDWDCLESRLSAWLRAVPVGESVILRALSPYDDLDGATPYVQITVDDNGAVNGEATSNNYLDSRLALDTVRIARLEGMGWSSPTCSVDELPDTGSANFFIDLQLPGDAARLAELLAGTLREVFGVPHPSFLTVAGFGSAGVLDSDGVTFGLAVYEPEMSPAMMMATMPDGPDELRDLVEEALATVVDHELVYDIDGDIPLHVEGTLMFVRVEEGAPSIRVFAPILAEVRWTPRVGSALSQLNTRASFAKVTFSEGVLTASIHLFAEPFVSDHLLHAVDGVRGLVVDAVDELQATLGGARFSAGVE